MVEGVARRVDQAAAIGDGDAAPAVEEIDEARWAPFAARRLALGADRPSMLQELRGNRRIFRAPLGRNRRLASLRNQHLVTGQELLDLEHTVGKRFLRGID